MATLLAIESSCDETSVAMLDAETGTVLSCVVRNQLATHARYGGVIPEVAARDHLTTLPVLVDLAWQRSGRERSDLVAIGVTQGPGLLGALLVGVQYARSYGSVAQVPVYGINHLEGHILAAEIESNIAWPHLTVLASGGHTMILLVRGYGQYECLAQTVDDAIGEAYDKVARLIGLHYPGGPHVMHAARRGDANRHPLPRPLLRSGDGRISMSGLKTAIIDAMRPLGEDGVAAEADHFAAAFETAVGDVLVAKSQWVYEQAKHKGASPRALVFTGGVAANAYLRERLQTLAHQLGIAFVVPAFEYCTDNAAMIGRAALRRWQQASAPDVDLEPRSRWPLDSR